jgi:hypothetical protein
MDDTQNAEIRHLRDRVQELERKIAAYETARGHLVSILADVFKQVLAANEMSAQAVADAFMRAASVPTEPK